MGSSELLTKACHHLLAVVDAAAAGTAAVVVPVAVAAVIKIAVAVVVTVTESEPKNHASTHYSSQHQTRSHSHQSSSARRWFSKRALTLPSPRGQGSSLGTGFAKRRVCKAVSEKVTI